MSPRKGWEPGWSIYASVAAVSVAAALASLLLWALTERKNSQALLYSMLPKSAIKHLNKNSGDPFAEKFECVTILFCDIVDYTPLASRLDPMEIMEVSDRHAVW